MFKVDRKINTYMCIVLRYKFFKIKIYLSNLLKKNTVIDH